MKKMLFLLTFAVLALQTLSADAMWNRLFARSAQAKAVATAAQQTPQRTVFGRTYAAVKKHPVLTLGGLGGTFLAFQKAQQYYYLPVEVNSYAKQLLGRPYEPKSSSLVNPPAEPTLISSVELFFSKR